MHYSMMLTKSKKAITTGPKHFPTEMCDSEGDETEEEEEDRNKESGEEPNSAYRRTMIKGRAKTKNTKAIGAAANQNKNTTSLDRNTVAGNQDNMSIQTRPRPHDHDNHDDKPQQTRPQLHDHDNHIGRTQQTRPKPPWRRRVKFQTNEKVVTNAAAIDSTHDEDWTGVEQVNTTTDVHIQHDMTRHDNTIATPPHHHRHAHALCNQRYNDSRPSCHDGRFKHVLQTPRTTTHTLSRASQHHTIAHQCRLPTAQVEVPSLSPRGRSPTPGAIASSETAEDKHLSRRLLQQTRVCPERLVASEYQGTRASRLIVNGGHASDEHSAVTGSMRCRGQPQPQRCEDPCSAGKESLVVAPGSECQGESSGGWVGVPPFQDSHPNSPLCGSRRIREQGCLQHILSHHFVRGLDGRGGGGQPKRLPAHWSTPVSAVWCRGASLAILLPQASSWSFVRLYP